MDIVFASNSVSGPAARRSPAGVANRRGVALVAVMAALALISFLVLVILTLSQSEQRAAVNSVEIAQARMLAELPQQLVISQIRRATQGLGRELTWTSQPGLIRVFDASGPPATGTARRPQLCYPLYSGRTMYADTSFDVAAEAADLRNWVAAPALFTDLNEPVAARPLPGSPPGALRPLVFPILDPLALAAAPGADQPLIDGLRMSDSAGPGSTQPARNNEHPLPLPVRWLYVLSNGRVIAPLPSSAGTVARFPQSEFQPRGDQEAPRIVGRIAFWTDDESCKVNLNTATEPAPWLPPSTSSETDRWAAEAPPVAGEWHRLSGHPAATALSAVFRSFGSPFPAPIFQPLPLPPGGGFNAGEFTRYVDAIHGLAPAGVAADGGSRHGTLAVDGSQPLPLARFPALLGSVDELVFDSGVTTGAGVERPRRGWADPGGYSMDELDARRARFCATTHSSAPETNPLNQPKMSLWPLQAAPGERTRTDQVMALASTLGAPAGGERPFYALARAAAWSGGAPGSSASTVLDFLAVPRNQALFDWLRELATLPVPGFGESFLRKYGERNRDQIVLGFFDQLRWVANPGNDCGELGPVWHYLAPPGGAGAPPPGAGAVAPLRMNIGAAPLRGAGRVPVITEAALVLMATEAERDANGDIVPDPEDPEFALRTTEVRAFVVLEPFLPAAGHPAAFPRLRYVLKGLDGISGPALPGVTLNSSPFSLAGVTLRFGQGGEAAELANEPRFSPSSTALNVPGAAARHYGGDALPYSGLTGLFVREDGTPRTGLGDGQPSELFSWASNVVALPNEVRKDTPVSFVGGDVLLEIRDAGSGEILQEVVLPFSWFQDEVLAPRLALADFALAASGAGSEPMVLDRFRLRESPAPGGNTPFLPLIRNGDVVRSLQLNPAARHGGDPRVLANLPLVDGSAYAPVPSTTASPAEAHHLREGVYERRTAGGLPALRQLGVEAQQPGRTPAMASGQLLAGGLPVSPLPAVEPVGILPPTIVEAVPGAGLAGGGADLRYGDWETAPGALPDGPWIARQTLVNAASEAEYRRGSQANPASSFSDSGQLVADVNGVSHHPLSQVSSAVIFGALSPWVHDHPGGEGVPSRPAQGWRTLLFCPNPASRVTPANEPPTEADHPGFGSPPDHLWLDFFWMPVTAPRLMSPGFSTEGKVNMNFAMVPFNWIERSTALHAALRGVRIPAIPANAGGVYKLPPGPGGGPPAQPVPEFQYEVDTHATLNAFRERFRNGEVFTQPSEICSVYLVPRRIEGREALYGPGLQSEPPDPATLAVGAAPGSPNTLNEWWNGDPTAPIQADAMELTGDNLRESPYGQVYPRLCTRSNVFRVHYRVQWLGKSRATQAFVWDGLVEKVLAEQRGSVVVERYLDPNDPLIPDFAGEAETAVALDDFYRYRILSREPFTP
jgi:uncharacterized protein (TIGR02600 family)